MKRLSMPTISSFYGIKIYINPIDKEHNPPHIHANYSGNIATFNIKECELMEGNLGKKQNKMVEGWIAIHQEELLNIWKTQEFKTITPLQ